jgi:NitT/TauT family transport system substrate-binding protein
MHIIQSRRDFLTTVSAAGAICIVCARRALADEGPPETTTVRLPRFFPASCEIPEYVAGELLHAEGFTDVRFVEGDSGVDSSQWIAHGELDFDWNYAATHIASIQAGVPITVLAGMHSGCLELIAKDSVRNVADLRGMKVGVYASSSAPQVLVTLMAAYIGLDPTRDIEWVMNYDMTSMQLFVDGKIDAFLAIPPEPQDLRDRGIGRYAHQVRDASAPDGELRLGGRAELVGRPDAARDRSGRTVAAG